VATDILQISGTGVVFKQTGGNVAFNPVSITPGQVRYSAQYDRGTAATPSLYSWRARTKAAVAPTVGGVMTVYLAAGDGTDIDGDIGTGGGLLTSVDQLRNITPIGVVVVNVSSTTTVFTASGTIEIWDRYVTVLWRNDFSQNLSATSADHSFTLTPKNMQIQG
jgi:hypothetical protein